MLAGTVPNLRAALFALVEQVVFSLLSGEACFDAELAFDVAFLALATAEEDFAEELRDRHTAACLCSWQRLLWVSPFSTLGRHLRHQLQHRAQCLGTERVFARRGVLELRARQLEGLPPQSRLPKLR